MSQRRVRRVGILLAMLAVAGLLAGCTANMRAGLRLNSDGSIDFVDCFGLGRALSVEYLRDDATLTGTWRTQTESYDRDAPPRVVLYGEDPAGYVTRSLSEAGNDWDHVRIDYGYFEKSELVVGEWVWFTSEASWIPDRPCVGLELDESGEPVEPR